MGGLLIRWPSARPGSARSTCILGPIPVSSWRTPNWAWPARTTTRTGPTLAIRSACRSTNCRTAHTADHGTWYSTVQVVVPNLGAVPVRTPIALPTPGALPVVPIPLKGEVESPSPGDQVGRSFIVQVLAPGADRVDVFLEPDRDEGGRLIGSAPVPASNLAKLPVTASLDGHTLYVHLVSTASRQEQVITVPIIVRS
jgi:hypothetical protein